MRLIRETLNYPIKALLVEMVENGQLKMDDPLHLFCASWLSVRVSFVGIELFVKSCYTRYSILSSLSHALFAMFVGCDNVFYF